MRFPVRQKVLSELPVKIIFYFFNCFGVFAFPLQEGITDCNSTESTNEGYQEEQFYYSPLGTVVLKAFPLFFHFRYSLSSAVVIPAGA